MTDIIADHLQFAVDNASTWGFVFIFVFMTIESSFIPFPSEVVMIPAGFLAVRGELSSGNPVTDLLLSIICGLLGSVAGAYINYYLALWLGRPILYKYGKYFFLPEKSLKRSEEIFLEYGDLTTFVCRLIPAIRQLISIPAGLARMPHGRFVFYTSLGAGIWVSILAGIGYHLGTYTKNMTYRDLIQKGTQMVHHNFSLILLGLAVIVFVYVLIHKKVMKSKN